MSGISLLLLFSLRFRTWFDVEDDGLSNLEEQELETDPLTNDTDTDGILDPDELQEGTYPCDPDSDHDLLEDSHELILGTDQLDNDTNSNGQWDGNETYWSTNYFFDETLSGTVRGRGYAIQNGTASAVNYTHLISDEILVSGVFDVRFGTDTSYGTVAITYDPTHVSNVSTLSMYRFDEEDRTFLPVTSTVNAQNHIVSANVTNSSKYAVMDTVGWDALFEGPDGPRTVSRGITTG